MRYATRPNKLSLRFLYISQDLHVQALLTMAYERLNVGFASQSDEASKDSSTLIEQDSHQQARRYFIRTWVLVACPWQSASFPLCTGMLKDDC